MNQADIEKLAQNCFKHKPTIVLGSGASMPHGLPSMWNLQQHLIENIAPETDADLQAWQIVAERLEGDDHLEASLEDVSLSAGLIQQIVLSTWECVNAADKALFLELVRQPEGLPLGKLLQSLFHSTHKRVDIVTTNYDRVVEFACNSVGLPFQTGFTPGYFQQWESTNGIQYFRANQATRVVKVWKVHGSLDWFKTGTDELVGIPALELPGGDLIPQIVTPGLNKYEKTHGDPFRGTMHGADEALEGASSFLCYGFGFRDSHIQPKLIARCREMNVPITVLAKELTDEAKAFLANQAGSNFLGVEEHEAGCRAFTPAHPEGEVVEQPGLWTLGGFLEMVL